MMNLATTVALVSGANRGVGQALVSELLAAGVKKVYAGARDINSLRDWHNSRVVPLMLDVTNIESLRAASAAADDITLLINNAGVLSAGDALSVSDAEIQRNFAVNFYGVINVSRALSEHLAKNGGTIVNVLTLLSLASMPSFAAYNASKAAAWSLTQSLRASLKERGVNVHGVFPGAIDTDMLAGIEIPKTSPEEVAKAIIQGF